jgi:hypothetical protein
MAILLPSHEKHKMLMYNMLCELKARFWAGMLAVFLFDCDPV